jgi:uncharacterized membrane protein
MKPIMRLVLPLVGILIAAIAGSSANRGFNLLVGAFLGFALADLGLINARLDALAEEIRRLTQELRRRQVAPQESTSAEPRGTPPPPAELHVATTAAVATSPDRPWQDFEPVTSADAPKDIASAPYRIAPPPAEPPPIVAFLRNFFTGGNTLVRVGIIVLFFGVAFLLRYMAEHTHVPSRCASPESPWSVLR